MVTEVVYIIALPDKEEELGQAIIRGLDVIRQHPGCIAANVTRCIEQPRRFMLTNTWTSLDAHIVDFRGSPLFPQWRSHIAGLVDGAPEVLHYQVF
jgi:quinol monooxygenase YgiN